VASQIVLFGRGFRAPAQHCFLGEASVENPAELAVARAIATMRDNLGEPLTVDDLARAALFSKFHFSRVFQRETGVSPGRFLSAMRLQQAKRLLVSTSLNVADISVRVGYSSVGTFSSRFSRSVGMSPTAYRRLGGFTPRMKVEEAMPDDRPASGVLEGRVWQRQGMRRSPIFIGLFADRIPQGRPVRCTKLDQPGPYRLDRVPAGEWFLLSQCATCAAPGQPLEQAELAVATKGPITVEPTSVVKSVDIRLKPAGPLEPPVLLSLLDVRRALSQPAAA
jgi:AraC family transcriptional regulator